MTIQMTIWGGAGDGPVTGIPTTRPTQGMTHRNDPPTANGAAIIALHDRPNLRARCLEAIRAAGAHGLTDFELADIIGRGQTSVGKRRLELQRDGYVEPVMLGDSQLRRLSPTGTPAGVYRAAVAP